MIDKKPEFTLNIEGIITDSGNIYTENIREKLVIFLKSKWPNDMILVDADRSIDDNITNIKQYYQKEMWSGKVTLEKRKGFNDPRDQIETYFVYLPLRYLVSLGMMLRFNNKADYISYKGSSKEELQNMLNR